MRLALLALFAFAVTVRADDTDDFLKADNWKGIKEYWTVDAKARTVTGKTEADPKFNTFLCSQQDYGDFDMSFKVKMTGPKANSGIQVRSSIVDKEKFIVAGPQCDMGAQYWGSLYGEKVGGMMKASDAKMVKKLVKVDDFNDYSLSVKGNHITITVNGETMTDGDYPMQPDKKPMPKTGIIAFQIHAGGPMTAEFKEIKFSKK
ncbi:hypothetical protein BH11PLA2_BH11PLA2_34110 [soil metagenome]